MRPGASSRALRPGTAEHPGRQGLAPGHGASSALSEALLEECRRVTEGAWGAGLGERPQSSLMEMSVVECELRQWLSTGSGGPATHRGQKLQRTPQGSRESET